MLYKDLPINCFFKLNSNVYQKSSASSCINADTADFNKMSYDDIMQEIEPLFDVPISHLIGSSNGHKKVSQYNSDGEHSGMQTAYTLNDKSLIHVYFNSGVIHRLDGPAKEMANEPSDHIGNKFFINGKHYVDEFEYWLVAHSFTGPVVKLSTPHKDEVHKIALKYVSHAISRQDISNTWVYTFRGSPEETDARVFHLLLADAGYQGVERFENIVRLPK